MSFASTLWAAVTRYSMWDIITIVGGGLAITAVGAFAVSIYSDIKTAGAAKAEIACVQSINASNDTAWQELAATNKRAADAMAIERDKAKQEADQRLFAIHDLELQLKNKPAQTLCGYSPEVTGSLRK